MRGAERPEPVPGAARVPLETSKTIAEQSEGRFKDDNLRLREDKQMSGLVESMQRIETGLASQKAEEAKALAADRNRLRAALETARKDAADADRADQQRSAQDAELKLERSKQKVSAAMVSAKDDLRSEQAAHAPRRPRPPPWSVRSAS